MSHASLIGKIIMSEGAERRFYEDQATILSHSGPNLRGNASTVVLVHPGGREQSFGATAWAAVVLTEAGADLLARNLANGARVIDGAKLFTPRDRPRPYRAPKGA